MALVQLLNADLPYAVYCVEITGKNLLYHLRCVQHQYGELTRRLDVWMTLTPKRLSAVGNVAPYER